MKSGDTRDSAMGAPTVFIVDDDDSLRRGLARLVRSEGWDVEAFASGREFLERPTYAGIGCAVLDVCMPGMTGPELHAQMLARDIGLPVIFLTAFGDVPTAVRALKMGSIDFLTKPVEDGVLLQSIRDGIERHVVDQATQRQHREVAGRLSRLSPREREVMRLVTGGLLNKLIAARLGISLQTVKVHRARVMEKMKARSVAELVHICELEGIAQLDPCPRGRAAVRSTPRFLFKTATATRRVDRSLKPGEHVTWHELGAVSNDWAKGFRQRVDGMRSVAVP
jgi:FixJ family two-component response regulator